MYQLIFATNNAHKVAEIQKVCPPTMQIISLAEAGINKDIPEPYDTLEENAQEKARVIFEMTGKDCFAEDSGLMIDALNGAPGVMSARYAGEHGNHAKNIAKVLQEMQGVTERTARFTTVIAYCKNGAMHLFKGVCEGSIALNAAGHNGFGYDPIFIPSTYTQTFGELPNEVKLGLSHRTKAFSDFSLYLLPS